MNNLYLYGASGHAKVILDAIRVSGTDIRGVYDDDINKIDFQGFKVIHKLSDISDPTWIISIGDNYLRKEIAKRLAVIYASVIHPSAVMAEDVELGAGTVVMAGAIINTSTEIGKHGIVNTSASVDHDCRIGDFVHISPNATLCGNISIGDGTHVGAGATIIPNLAIGKNVVIGAGTVVIDHISDNCTVVGNPGRVIKNGK